MSIIDGWSQIDDDEWEWAGWRAVKHGTDRFELFSPIGTLYTRRSLHDCDAMARHVERRPATHKVRLP